MGVVTYPFKFEGKRGVRALEGIETLRNNLDCVIVIPNDRLMAMAGEGVPIQETLALADDVLRQGVQVRVAGSGY